MTDLRHEDVTVGDAVIHAVTAGPAAAPGLLLLHGWPESWVTWRELIPLAAREHRVVAIDLRHRRLRPRRRAGIQGRHRARGARTR
jgi:pimeloyl-ACP methyl ester carboxylesterase